LKKHFKILFSALPVLLFTSCDKEKSKSHTEIPDFVNEQQVLIQGYQGDAMEPFISKDDKYLFFNSLDGENNKDIYYASKINDTSFLFLGEVKGVNTSFVDANPTMDNLNNFYFISTRDLDSGNGTVFCGKFDNGIITNLHKIEGSVNIVLPGWINMGVEISADGELMLISNAHFSTGAVIPDAGNIHMTENEGGIFNLTADDNALFMNINNDKSIQYAGELSANGHELLYSQVTLSVPPIFELLYAVREDNGIFGTPVAITEPFKNNPYSFVEAPTLSSDGKRLYYHKKNENGIFCIYMLTRK